MKTPRVTIGTNDRSQIVPKMKPPLSFPSGGSIWEQVWHLFYGFAQGLDSARSVNLFAGLVRHR